MLTNPSIGGRALDHIDEPARSVPVACTVDLCVVGGSCTGVFAAVRAARLGLRVALVERQGLFGGMATTALVTHWHRDDDVDGTRTIVGGLTQEMLERLRHRRALLRVEHDRLRYKFNPAVMACELDDLVAGEAGIRPFLCSTCSTALVADGRIEAIVIEDRSGRRAIRARIFVDASGDGELLRRAGFAARQADGLQPVAYQALAEGIRSLQGIWPRVRHLAARHGFPDSNPWDDVLAGVEQASNLFGARLSGVDASDPDQLTAALMRGRRLAATYIAMIREAFPEAADRVGLLAVAPALGVRETWHAVCRHHLRHEELLAGTSHSDAIALGIYPVDIHHPGGCRLLFLDGRESNVAPGGRAIWSRWRDATEPTPPYYQVPYRSMLPVDAENLIVAGRLVDADREAYGALRVMIICNQTGEAAGIAAAIAVEARLSVAEVPVAELRSRLNRGGSLLPGV